MGFQYRRRIRTGKNSWLNLSKSGVSGSFRVGPMTFNSRGRRSMRIAPGLSYRSSGGGCAMTALLLVVLSVVVVVAAAST